MATTATLIEPVGVPFPFIGIGVASAQVITPIPSAEFVFNVISGSITVAAGGEDQSLLINCFLPRSFCYVLVELSARIEGADSADWLKGASTTLQDSSSVPTNLIPMVFESKELSAVSSAQKAYVASVIPTKLIIPPGIDDAKLACFWKNPVIDGAVGIIHFYARFLRYDRNQAQFWQVNTPTLIR